MSKKCQPTVSAIHSNLSIDQPCVFLSPNMSAKHVQR